MLQMYFIGFHTSSFILNKYILTAVWNLKDNASLNNTMPTGISKSIIVQTFQEQCKSSAFGHIDFFFYEREFMNNVMKVL